MTDDARNAAIGRMVTEYRDKTSHLVALQSELDRAGRALQKLGQDLRTKPHLLNFGGDSFPMADGYIAADVEVAYLDKSRLQSQVREYRQVKDDVDHLAVQIQRLGLTP